MTDQHGKNTLAWTLLLTTFLFVFAKFSEPGLGVSSTTYGALARDIVENGRWFNPTVGHKMNDPLVDHPFLVIWIDALVFKIFGISAQTIRLTASVMGIFGFLALFLGVKNILSEKVAYLACVLLMTITVYMNYHSSGWLDLPMVCFYLFAFYFVSQQGFKAWQSALCGLMISCAVLAKGAGALAVFPIFLFAMLQSKHKARDFLLIATCALVPFFLFTWGHYRSQGFLFWQVYVQRQFGALNNADAQLSSAKESLWYLIEAFKSGHLVTALSLPGLWFLFKKGLRNIALLIAGLLVIHILAYSTSSRHYGQYLLPIYPWIAVAAAYMVSLVLKDKLNAHTLARYTCLLSMVFFVGVEILPIQVHSVSGVRFKSLQNLLYFNSTIKTAYFMGDTEDQSTWEAESSYIRWYLNKWPVALKADELKQKIHSLADHEVVLAPKGFIDLEPCAYNADLGVYAMDCAALSVKSLNFADQNRYLP